MLDSDYASKLYEAIPADYFKWILKPNEFNYEIFRAKWLLLYTDNSMISIIKPVAAVHSAVLKEFQNKYNGRVAKYYFNTIA